MGKIIFGCFADDFTGASDAASFIQESGMRTILVKGVPSDGFKIPEDTDCIVIGMKSRTVPVNEAISKSLEAYGWLEKHGAEHIYFKYCSTFDSTDKGNIGPVVDAVMDKYNIKSTLLCPALPANGRTVRNGNIYVDGIPLNKTHMRFHPLTPMTSSYIPQLMDRQGKYVCCIIERKTMSGLLAKDLPGHDTSGKTYYIPDYEKDNDAELIADIFSSYKFLTGGSGILTTLSSKYIHGKVFEKALSHKSMDDSRVLLLAGSCSAATLMQIKMYKEDGGLAINVSPDILFEDKPDDEILDKYWSIINSKGNAPVLVYSSSAPEKVKEYQQEYGMESVSAKLESFMAGLAVKAAKTGWKNIIVAGGETSGAVTEALKADAYEIGISVAPGVPIMYPINHDDMQLVLKSGNFGKDDFFLKTIDFMVNGSENMACSL